MRLIYKDEHIAVAEKGFGEISELPEAPEPKAEYTPLLLRRAFAEAGEATEVFTVHRLDRTTAGLMVYARTPTAAAALSAQLQNGRLEKIYLAAIHGTPVEAAGELRDELFFDRRKGKAFVADKKRRGTKEAVLTYGLLESRKTRYGTVSILRVALLTGRTHQIRVQLAHRGMPLLGDGKYGSRVNYKGCALFSAELRFIHPTTGEPMEFTAVPRWTLE